MKHYEQLIARAEFAQHAAPDMIAALLAELVAALREVEAERNMLQQARDTLRQVIDDVVTRNLELEDAAEARHAQ